jgi:hypothetical protein
MDSIANGYDSMQIRIWLSYGSIDSQQVVVLIKRTEFDIS